MQFVHDGQGHDVGAWHGIAVGCDFPVTSGAVAEIPVVAHDESIGIRGGGGVEGMFVAGERGDWQGVPVGGPVDTSNPIGATEFISSSVWGSSDIAIGIAGNLAGIVDGG